MKKAVLYPLFMCCCLLSCKCFALDLKSQDSVYFSGKFIGLRGKTNIGLRAFYWVDLNHPMSTVDRIDIDITLSRDGSFNFALLSPKLLGRLTLVSVEYGEILLNQIVERADNIHILIEKIKSGNQNIIFSGTGKEKYECAMNLGRMYAHNNCEKAWKYSDSIYADKLLILNQFKGKLSKIAYEVMREDLRSTIMGIDLLLTLKGCYLQAGDSLVKAKRFEDLMTVLSEQIAVSDEIARLSDKYIEFVYEKIKLNLVCERIGQFAANDIFYNKKIRYAELYNKIRNEFTGVLRERLLTFSLLHNWDMTVFFFGADALEFTNCLEDAAVLIQDSSMKYLVQSQLKRIGKGADGYNFVLKDTSGQSVRLSDFKGKVVLIDSWNNPCSGCLVFKKMFEEKVYPYVIKDSNFVVVSISFNKTWKSWIDGISKYSDRRFVNLYTEGLALNHPFVKHYNIAALPFLLLIDKEGKIYSATLPWDESGVSLLELIKKALLAS